MSAPEGVITGWCYEVEMKHAVRSSRKKGPPKKGRQAHVCSTHPAVAALSAADYKLFFNNKSGIVDEVIPERIFYCRECQSNSHFFFVHFKDWDVFTVDSMVPPRSSSRNGWLILEAEHIVCLTGLHKKCLNCTNKLLF
jgi:hypothetical protein